MGIQQSLEYNTLSRSLHARSNLTLKDLVKEDSENDSQSVFNRWKLLRHDGRSRLFFTRTAIQAAMTVEPSESTKSQMGYQAFIWSGYMGYMASTSFIQKMWQRGWMSHGKAMIIGIPVVTVSTLFTAGMGDALATPCVTAGLRTCCATMWALKGLHRDLTYKKKVEQIEDEKDKA